MQHDNKNFILAIVLSTLIIIGWQYFYAVPTQKKIETQTTSQGTTVSPQQQPGATVPGTTQSTNIPRETAVASGKRIRIDTPVIDGMS